MNVVKCPYCGQMQVFSDDGICIRCHRKIEPSDKSISTGISVEENLKDETTQGGKYMTSVKKRPFHIVLSIICFAISAFFMNMGYDKYTNYYNSEYSATLNQNAYVGGDAYNYIINASYMTAFFVVALIFVVIGMGILILRQIAINGDKMD